MGGFCDDAMNHVNFAINIYRTFIQDKKKRLLLSVVLYSFIFGIFHYFFIIIFIKIHF